LRWGGCGGGGGGGGGGILTDVKVPIRIIPAIYRIKIGVFFFNQRGVESQTMLSITFTW